MSASRRAGKVLGGSFAEAFRTGDGFFHWETESIFNPKAFEIVMKIIHAKQANSPSK